MVTSCGFKSHLPHMTRKGQVHVPVLFLVTSRSHLNPGFKVSGLLCKPSVRGKLRLRHAALSGCYRIRRCRGFAVYIRFDFHSFASKLALGKSKRLCMAHWTRNLPQHSFVEIRHIVWRIFFVFSSSRIYPCFTHVRCNAYRFAISFGEKIKITVDRKKAVLSVSRYTMI